MNIGSRILLTGGGTGGHIYPLIAVAQKIKNLTPNAEIIYAGSPGVYKELLNNSGIRIFQITSSKWRAYFSILNLFEPIKFFIGFFQALWQLYWFMPNVVFTKGGPGSLS